MWNPFKMQTANYKTNPAVAESLEQLPDATKRLIARSEQMVKDVEKEVREHSYLLDLTCKLQLRDDCAMVNKELEKLYKTGASEARIQSLWNASLRLRVSAENILKMDFDW